MKAIPTSWLHNPDGGRLWVDVNYAVWDMEKEVKVYQDTNTGAYSLQDVMDNMVHWDDDQDESLYDVDDFLLEILQTLDDKEARMEQLDRAIEELEQ